MAGNEELGQEQEEEGVAMDMMERFPLCYMTRVRMPCRELMAQGRREALKGLQCSLLIHV